jgi:hypothetical protein
MLETFSLIGVDKSISTAGVQNVSFSYNGLSIQQRIDRSHQLGGRWHKMIRHSVFFSRIVSLTTFFYFLFFLEYWTFARPTLQPINFSLLVHGGDDGFAAVVNGSFSLFAPGAPPSGYVDGE